MNNIGFYGHSNCAYRSPGSFIDLVSAHYGSTIRNIGVRQGSEERILFELKKTKILDLAIIFHSEPQYIFLPECDRDIGINNITEYRAEYLFKEWNSNFSKEHHSKFLNKFKNQENFLVATQHLREYFYHPDLQLNRFFGSLIQIDQYLLQKKIPCIHVINHKTLPTWFSFKSGTIDYLIMDIVKSNPLKKGEWFANCITENGNNLIFERLKELVEEVIPPSPGAVA